MELHGKKVNFLGDSITFGVGIPLEERPGRRYADLLKARFGLEEARNYGASGTRFAYQRHPSAKPAHDLYFCGRAMKMSSDADLVVVFGGVNDYIHGDAPFGAIGDRTPETFCGAAWWLMDYLTTAYAGKTVVFVTPAHCRYMDIYDDRPSPRPMKAPDAKPLAAYVDAIKQTAAQFSIPVLDLFRTFSVDPNRPEDREAYTADGLHFNAAGNRCLADAIGAFLASL